MCAYWLYCLCRSLMSPLDGSNEHCCVHLNGDTLTMLFLGFLLSVVNPKLVKDLSEAKSFLAF